MLAQAAKPKSEIQNPKLACAPFFPLPFADHTFDLITCGLAVGHEKNLAKTLAEAARVLCPGGSILYSDLHPCGALLGWQRTFTAADGTVFEVEHHLHLYSAHQQACQAAGLIIDAVLEPLIGDHTSPEVQHVPAVLVIRAIKVG
jgi:malonyl-CoA O-methyltransferase